MAKSSSPKVFISYSWSSESHKELVRGWGERLLAAGIEVVLDQWDLKEGQDKFVFMETMVSDPKITHVLVVCDRAYVEKANSRKKGVGTETQIISKEVYEEVDQTKFIPILCEFDEHGDALLPAYFNSRIGIDFSSPEKVNQNWERLVRVLFGKPELEKPSVGDVPPYITDDSHTPASAIRSKYEDLRQAVVTERGGLNAYRKAFIGEAIFFVDRLRRREQPAGDLPQQIVDDCGKLKHVRNHLIDWIVLESEHQSEGFGDALIDLLELLREMGSRPKEVTTWNDNWFQAHSLFVYETFLYVIAALLSTKSFELINEVLTSTYIAPESESYSGARFDHFDSFYSYSDTINSALSENTKYLAPAAELIKRQSDRKDIPFGSIIEADLLCFMMSCIIKDIRWYPQTMHYAGYGASFPFFVRATQHKNFANLATVAGVQASDELKAIIKEGYEQAEVNRWQIHDVNVWSAMNVDKFDTIK